MQAPRVLLCAAMLSFLVVTPCLAEVQAANEKGTAVAMLQLQNDDLNQAMHVDTNDKSILGVAPTSKNEYVDYYIEGWLICYLLFIVASVVSIVTMVFNIILGVLNPSRKGDGLWIIVGLFMLPFALITVLITVPWLVVIWIAPRVIKLLRKLLELVKKHAIDISQLMSTLFGEAVDWVGDFTDTVDDYATVVKSAVEDFKVRADETLVKINQTVSAINTISEMTRSLNEDMGEVNQDLDVPASSTPLVSRASLIAARPPSPATPPSGAISAPNNVKSVDTPAARPVEAEKVPEGGDAAAKGKEDDEDSVFFTKEHSAPTQKVDGLNLVQRGLLPL